MSRALVDSLNPIVALYPTSAAKLSLIEGRGAKGGGLAFTAQQ